jgi:hypothetical protein
VVDAPHRLGDLVVAIAEISRLPVENHFRRRSASAGDDRGPTGHRLDHGQAEGLGPEDGEEKSARPTQQLRLLLFSDLSDELDPRMSQQRPDHLVEVSLIHLVDLGRNHEANASAPRCFDGDVRPLLR